MSNTANNVNIFEQACRKALRYPSIRGAISTEQLFELPLQSKSGFDLDSVAKAVNAELKAQTEESFVVTASNPLKAELTLKLEVVKTVIAIKIEENAAAAAESDRKRQLQKLLAIAERRAESEMENLSLDEINARIAALGGATVAAPAAAPAAA